MQRFATAVLAVSLFTFGCTTQPTLLPSTDARLVDNNVSRAADVSENVRLEARVRSWRWAPRKLDEFVTPVFVVIQNQSDRTIRVRLSNLQLQGVGGISMAALPPFEVEGEIVRRVKRYAYGSKGFFVAPHLHSSYPGFQVWSGAFAFNPFYYRTYQPVYSTYEVALPTRDMLVRALPEGSLEPGGRIAGFVYFERSLESLEDSVHDLHMVFDLVDAETGGEFGLVEIPFEVYEWSTRGGINR